MPSRSCGWHCKQVQLCPSSAWAAVCLQMSPFLGPLDKDLVKLIIKLLRSPAFLGAAQLLAAVASTDAELRTPVGLLKVTHGWGCSALVLDAQPLCLCACRMQSCYCSWVHASACTGRKTVRWHASSKISSCIQSG